jgi:hypothetical protein
MTPHYQRLRLTPFLTGLRVSSLPLWLTWFWFTNRSLLLRLPWTTTVLRVPSFCQSQSHNAVCLSWCRAPSGDHDQIFILVCKLLSCPYGASSLTRGRVCHLSVIVCSFKSVVSIYNYLHFASYYYSHTQYIYGLAFVLVCTAAYIVSSLHGKC